ncbi:ABC transporter permease subunit [Plantibacter sp. Mn2098]|uniref:ABC transporter permease subunit n=1 Tax=Plantibacter sp. Mn2098 TaxID=3395266 RepID=UPI003BBBE789
MSDTKFSTTTTEAVDRAQHRVAEALGGLSFARILRSEQIKLFSLRSTWWALATIVFLQVAVGTLMSFGMVSSFRGETPPGADGAAIGMQVATFGVFLAQLIAAVLGALAITGEYSTGMIRSTLTAAPGRLSTLFAKAIVVATALFVTGIVGVAATVAATTPILAPSGLTIDASSIGPLTLSALYLAMIAVFSLTIGFLLRSGAGAIGAGLAVILVAPIMVSMIPGEVAQTVATILPSNAGQSMFTHPMSGSGLEPWQGFLVLLAWIIVGLVAAGTALRRRDA